MDCRNANKKKVLTYFYENEFDLKKFKEKFPDDQVEIISLTKLVPKIEINLAELVEELYRTKISCKNIINMFSVKQLLVF